MANLAIGLKIELPKSIFAISNMTPENYVTIIILMKCLRAFGAVVTIIIPILLIRIACAHDARTLNKQITPHTGHRLWWPIKLGNSVNITHFRDSRFDLCSMVNMIDQKTLNTLNTATERTSARSIDRLAEPKEREKEWERRKEMNKKTRNAKQKVSYAWIRKRIRLCKRFSRNYPWKTHAREMAVGWLAGWMVVRLFFQPDYVATESE